MLCLSKALNQSSSIKARDMSSASSQSSLPSPAPACQGCFSFLPALWHQAVGGIPSQWQILTARELPVWGAAFSSVHTAATLATSCLYSHPILSAAISTLCGVSAADYLFAGINFGHNQEVFPQLQCGLLGTSIPLSPNLL